MLEILVSKTGRNKKISINKEKFYNTNTNNFAIWVYLVCDKPNIPKLPLDFNKKFITKLISLISIKIYQNRK